MRRFRRLVAFALVALGCNEVLGLDAGKREPDETGGASGAAGAAGISGTTGIGMGGSTSTTGGSTSTIGGSTSTTGGDGGTGESGAPAGGAAGSGGSRGGGGGKGGTGEPPPGGAGAGGDGPCTSSKACREDGYDFCIQGICADITSGACDAILGDEWIEEDPEAEPYVLGALARLGNLDDPGDALPLVLAMREVAAGGRFTIEGEERRPVLLFCHDATLANLAPLEDALDHMAGFGVSSVLLLVPSRSEVETLVHRTLITRGEDVFFLDVGGGTGGPFEGLLNFSDSGRLWHMRGDTYSLAFPFRPLVEWIEEHVNPGASTGTAAEPTRLAIVTGTNDEFDGEILEWLSDRVFNLLRINGLPLAYQPEQAYFVSDTVMGDQWVDDVLAEIAPHIVLNFSSIGGFEGFIHDRFVARNIPLPFFVVPPSRNALERAPLLFTVDDRPALRTRIVGLSPASADDLTLYRAYFERIRPIVPPYPEWRIRFSENTYDAAYYLVYAAVAGGPGGSAKAAGFRRLISGPKREIGPHGIESVLTRLSSSSTATLSLSGPSGDFGFHALTGGRLAFANAWCIDQDQVNGQGNLRLDYALDVRRYDHALGDFTGTFTCFDP